MRVTTTLRPLVSLGFLVGIFGLMWLAILLPAITWKQARLDTHAIAINETQHLAASIGQLESELSQLSQQDNFDLVWTAEKFGEVTARVQAEISSSAIRAGVVLRSVTPNNAPSFPFVETVGFRIEGEAALDQLVRLLRTIETSRPALVIEKANLRRLSRVGSTQELPLLYFQMELAAPIRTSNGEAND